MLTEVLKYSVTPFEPWLLYEVKAALFVVWDERYNTFVVTRKIILMIIINPNT